MNAGKTCVGFAESIIIQSRNKHTILSKVLNYLSMEKQHKKRYIKMIRMISSKDERTCEDKVRCIEHRALIQMLITKVTYNTRGIYGSKYRRTRRCIRNRRNEKMFRSGVTTKMRCYCEGIIKKSQIFT